MGSNLVEIKVLGTSFKIQVDEDPAYMKEILDYLEKIISKVETTTGMKDPLRIALLASVYVIDELYKERDSGNNQSIESEFTELTERIINCIESVLEND
ncbi:MAG: cell division protein ZapA [Spirochaetia bacterium]|jgi:cell division protein ZapA (FtsZ GTPase activity inhibitor)|nr:cell division protein ZapA [Spirochaetia bacterium]